MSLREHVVAVLLAIAVMAVSLTIDHTPRQAAPAPEPAADQAQP